MRLVVFAVLLLPALALGIAACAEEPEVPANAPTEAVGPTGLPPLMSASVASAKSETAAVPAGAATDAPAHLQVVTPRASVQFYGPVSTVNVAPAAPPPAPPGG
jgi:hypothetical protein